MVLSMLYHSLDIDSPSKNSTEAGPPLRITVLGSRAVRKFLDSSPCETTAFCRPDVLRTLLLTFERSLLALGMYRGKKLEGVALLLVQRKGPLGIVQRLPIRYAGLVGEPASMPEYLKRLREYLASNGIGKAYYSFSPWANPDPE